GHVRVVGAAEVAKARQKCQAAIAKVSAKLFDKRLATLDQCTKGILKCLASTRGDSACVGKAAEQCDGRVASLPAAETKATDAIKKACAIVGVDDLLSPDGLDYERIGARCASDFGLDLTDVASLARCTFEESAQTSERLFAVPLP